MAADEIFRNDAIKKTKDLQLRKEKSDKAYQIAVEELNDSYDDNLSKLREDFNRRGIFGGGMMLSATGKLEVRKQRAIEKLNLLFGKK